MESVLLSLIWPTLREYLEDDASDMRALAYLKSVGAELPEAEPEAQEEG